jgi:hypothetical protein
MNYWILYFFIIVVAICAFYANLDNIQVHWLQAHVFWPQNRYRYQPWMQFFLDRFLKFDREAFEALKENFKLLDAVYYKLPDNFNQLPNSIQEAHEILSHAEIFDVKNDVANILSALPKFDLKKVFDKGLLDIGYLSKTGKSLISQNRKLFSFPMDEPAVLPVQEEQDPNIYTDITVGEDDVTDLVNNYVSGNMFFVIALNSDATGDISIE